MTWCDGQQREDPFWAESEMDLRKKAIEIYEKLTQEGGQLTVYARLRDAASPTCYRIETLTFFHRRLGGLEELLVIEEQLRRMLRNVRTVQD